MTAGMPISRAVTAPWERGPPLSVTKAQAAWKSGVQAGFVVRATSTAPGGNDAKSSDDLTMKTGPSAMHYEIGRASCRKECRSRWSPYH